jgi:SulP family sulfate permease
LFVLNYSRVDVIRRQLTRRTFSSHVARSPADERRLREEGDGIHLYWLTGFLFFGSSHRLVGQIRRRIETQAPRPVRFVVLDFAATSGIDSAAVQSLAGLARFCSERNITVVCSSLDAATLRALAGTQLLVAPQPPEGFTNHNDALAWCEDRLLGGEGGQGVERDFGAWVTREMGLPGRAVDLLAYFRQRTLSAGDELYKEGSPADTIDIIADGKVAIVVSVGGRRLEVRRMEQLTVVGEMGFFRNQTRSASVVAVEPVTVFTLDRADFERMQNADPVLARAMLVFLIRTLSDRLEFANGAVRSLIDTAS